MTTKSTASTWLKPTKSISEIISERVEEVANRLVAPGPKAAHVSASECHEITDAIRAMRRIITGTIPARAYYPYDLVRAVSDAEQRERERLRRRVENALAFAHPGKSKDFNDGYVEAVTDALDAFPPVGKIEPEVQLNSGSVVEFVDGKWKRMRDIEEQETHVVVPVALLEEIAKDVADGEPEAHVDECEHGIRLTLNDCPECLDTVWCASPKCSRAGAPHNVEPGCPAHVDNTLVCPDCDKATEPARFWCGTCEKFWSNGYDKPNPHVVHNLMQAAKPIVEHIRSALARPVMLAMLAPFDIEIFERFLGAYKQVERESELPKDKSK